MSILIANSCTFSKALKILIFYINTVEIPKLIFSVRSSAVDAGVKKPTIDTVVIILVGIIFKNKIIIKLAIYQINNII